MKALVKAKPEPGLWLREVPVPTTGSNDVLIRVKKTGICGTDIHIFGWDEWARKTVPVPMVVGHEFAGEIVDVGSSVQGLVRGQRVSGEGHVIAMHGRAARSGRFHLVAQPQGLGVNIQGAFAEYVKIPAFNVVPLPDDIDDEVGAILDPLGNAVHTALSFDLVGEDVLITGAGPIGIMAAAVARHVGARYIVITDVNPVRLELAAKATDVVPVDVSKEDLASVKARLGIKEGFDVGLEMSGAVAAFNDLVEHLVVGGKIAMLGVPSKPFAVDWTKIVFKMLTVKGIYGREMFETWHKMLGMVQTGLDVRTIITHRLPARDFQLGFETMQSGRAGKIVLDWTTASWPDRA
ncbi:L-threonine 3-dehydrogenase [Bradyrhizobium sp. CCBAU 21360]|uniref:L-threonine 3-dehydrogenase n=1 Tax=Bradyrhizobium sp. CCBAU 21360 TaxID=1325081 RepID=UPI00230593DD|nr:L-threonine 3-dehydrogenase [Bradyrhizobium sp. CCBAU 21360]MDA9448311.1 L-threonine 3-dehydrogenase [Bradyrhizobium sp. CCBAU 21360]